MAQDGRVIGLVAHASLDKSNDEPPFYRGIPGADVANAVSEMGFDGLIALEDWATR